MRTSKKILCMILAIVMVVGLLPASALATEGDVVYLSISFDSNYIDDKNGNPIAYVPVSLDAIEAIDLTEYGLDNMLFDADGDGAYETTALQLLIYAHEELYGGDWGNVNFDPLPGSSYFKGGIFGFTENLVYFHNGDFPVDESQASDFMTVGATSDRIVLEAGDFLDVASFECYSFLWDQLGGFHLFADENDHYTHDYAANAGEALTVKLKHSFCDLMFGESWVKDAEDYEVYYGSTFGVPEGSVTTDGSGNAQITFPNGGTYYVWCEGGMGSDDGTHGTCDHYMTTGEPCIVSSPAFAKVTVTGAAGGTDEGGSDEGGNQSGGSGEGSSGGNQSGGETTRQPQDVSAVLDATLAMQAATVTQPAFGTNYGEWTVFGLARGGYYAKDSQYFADYYGRIVDYVNTTAAEVNMNGALDKNKSTDNSRLIMALSAIGKNATSVGNWNLVEAYSDNGINWIKKQGMNGTIWTLIALDCGGYETSDPTIRQQCVDAIVSAQHNDGGWSLVTAKTQPSNVDITGMTLTALYPYRDQPAVAAACETALEWLSESQLENGGFPYGQGETSESCVWAIVAATTWGINPDTDPRFIKNGNSAIDNLLTYYLEDQAMFEHGRGAGANAMATDQATYGLVAYDRFINGSVALYDYSDVELEAPEKSGISATMGIPANVDKKFNAVITVNKWDNEAGYKLVDFVMSIPNGLLVTGVTPGENLKGGSASYHLDSDSVLRCVYFDANENCDLTIDSEQFPAEIFNISFEIPEGMDTSTLQFGAFGMSIKTSSDSSNTDSQIVIDTTVTNDGSSGGSGGGEDTTPVFSAVELYKGDGLDLIPVNKKAVAVAITKVDRFSSVVYHGKDNNDDNNVQFKYSAEITAKTGVATFVALVDSNIPMNNFVDKDFFNVNVTKDPSNILFGDAVTDGTINAEDALAAVNVWLRNSETAPTDDQILILNVNGDSRINTYDALGIVEHFVNKTTFGVVTRAATTTAAK